MLTIEVKIPERKIGRHTFEARTDTFVRDADGLWSSPGIDDLPVTEVIGMAKRGTNWPEIKTKLFPGDQS